MKIRNAIGSAEVVKVLVDGESVVEDDFLRAIADSAATQHIAAARMQYKQEVPTKSWCVIAWVLEGLGGMLYWSQAGKASFQAGSSPP